MSYTLNRVRVAARDVVVPPVATATPPVPTRPEQAEPYQPGADHAPTTTAHRARLRALLREALRRLRNRLIQWREEAIREAWANGFRGGRSVERAEIQAELRSRLQAGRYHYRTSADAVREILRYLAEEQQQEG